ncbi:N-acetyltransferase GCN5 [Yersinia thracica]|uniref:N-acetyltransferase GCN5 n=1 Tax=Yersinia thracica TaxID=2890319 RepID=A0A0T9P0L3_9GAMM|nr:GNAT family N-acetyltransferase [Yersinia thracica]CNH39042.1 N-acetyltransferase GCN5 [Yersinia thracica]
MHKNRNLLFFLCILLSPLVYSGLEISFDYATSPIKDNTECSHYHHNLIDEEFYPCQINNTVPDVKQNKTEMTAKKSNLLICEEDCIISSKMVIPLDDIFSSTLDLDRPNKVALFNFELNRHSIFNLNLEDNVDITIDEDEMYILASDINSQQINYKLQPDTTAIAFIFEISNGGLAINYLESNSAKQGILSPTLIFNAERKNNLSVFPDLAIYNNILNGPLVMNRHLMVTMSDDHRTKRGAVGMMGCLLSGPLALYNVVVHGRCNQVESAWASIKSFFGGKDKAKMQLVAGSATALKPHPAPSEEAEKQSEILALTHIDLPSLHQQSLTLPAVAKACNIPLENLVSRRFPRQIDGPACGSWLSHLLADFTLLFGNSLRDWSTERLRQVLDSAIDTDSSGYAVLDTGTELRLMQGIRRGVRELGRTEAINQITRSFHYAERELAHYYLQTDGEDAMPSAVQNLPLGHYVLPLDNYTPITEPVPVRIRRNGEWETSESLAFQIEIISGEHQEEERELRAASLEVINEWFDKYYSLTYGTMLTKNKETHKEVRVPVTSADRIIYSARITSNSLKIHLEENTPGYLFVIVKINGEIIHLLEAEKYQINNEPQEGHYYLANFLTAPKYIINADSEGSIRGAGTAAVHRLARHLKNKGVNFIHSNVLSHPSARVKKKLGFEHDEL